ncbi:MAG: KTSC domain-containing protein [Chloroflexi bacterium]|nr:KTSC domain-containing protein [Chloroflexota bacterium]
MIRQPVSSSNLNSIGYDPQSMILEVEFHSSSGGVYQYSGVPQEIYGELMSAPSLGSFFHRHIRDKYPYQKTQ